MNLYASEELYYLVRFMDDYIEQMLYSVLADSEEDPEYSAVTLFNLVKCYIKVSQDLGIHTDYSTASEYLRAQCLDETDIEILERKRQKESSYYHGVQF